MRILVASLETVPGLEVRLLPAAFLGAQPPGSREHVALPFATSYFCGLKFSARLRSSKRSPDLTRVWSDFQAELSRFENRKQGMNAIVIRRGKKEIAGLDYVNHVVAG